MGDFERLIEEIEAEARADGPAAVAELAALDAHFRRVGEMLARRMVSTGLKGSGETLREGGPRDA